MDVNGMAGSIELYLGADILTEEGRLTPVQWTGYNAALGKYQGEVLNKDSIHERFREKLRRCSSCPEKSKDDSNWSAMHKLLSSIFSGFHTFDREMILSELEEHYKRE